MWANIGPPAKRHLKLRLAGGPIDGLLLVLFWILSPLIKKTNKQTNKQRKKTTF